MTKKENENDYSKLYRRLIFLTLLCSLIPLLLVGWFININYTRFAKSRMIDYFQRQEDNHQRAIDLFLKERISGLQLIASTHSLDYLSRQANLARIFEIMEREYGSTTDLGIIGDDGSHLAYIGPYDLLDKNYAQALWFKEVMKKNVYISDMFTGFRKVPHFIIAVVGMENQKKWILRATIDTEVFRSLVENVRIGKTGEVYLLNEEGLYQTQPRLHGEIMSRADFPMEPYHEGTKIRIFEADGKNHKQIAAQTWLNEPRWLLVVKQDYREAFYDVNHANYAMLIFLHLSAIAIIIVSIFITRHLIEIIKNRDVEADQLNRQLMQTGKLAAVGELSAGVAHEINNPLAIILTERQILLDLVEQTRDLNVDFKDALLSSLSQVDNQVQRCKRITQGLLRFARRTVSVVESVDLNLFLKELIELVEREARSSGIKFIPEFEKDLKPLLSDPSQLQQVFLNIITNAIDAHDDKPYGTIRVQTSQNGNESGVNVIISDTGSGIMPENMDKIFDPFFTTKPVGKGTGLGLSICYSIIADLGGNINVESTPGQGTTFTIHLPFLPPPELEKDKNVNQSTIKI